MYVVRQLHKAGFDSYIVGGGIRDLLAGKQPKDFDVATEALPKQIKKLFRRCFLIGRRFRIAHIYFGRTFIEVATFRTSHENAKRHQAHTKNGMIVRDNVYGSIEQDACRRDFTINSLYYDPNEKCLLDFNSGFHDLAHKQIRMIGDPVTRYQEDPIRMLRAIRFAAKLDFQITHKTLEPIHQLSHLLTYISPSRLYDEVAKLFICGASNKIFPMLEEHNLLPQLLPLTVQALKTTPKLTRDLIFNMLESSDLRVQQKKSISIIFIFSALLWHSFINLKIDIQTTEGASSYQAFIKATKIILMEQSKRTTLSRRVAIAIPEIWKLQNKLQKKKS